MASLIWTIYLMITKRQLKGISTLLLAAGLQGKLIQEKTDPRNTNTFLLSHEKLSCLNQLSSKSKSYLERRTFTCTIRKD